MIQLIQFAPCNLPRASSVSFHIYPAGNNFLPGGEIYKLPRSKKYTITRLTKKNKELDQGFITRILLKCIDDNIASQIALSIQEEDLYIDNTPRQSARTYATLVIKSAISVENQAELTVKFNTFLNEKRRAYNSLFLTNFRESKDLAYQIVEFILASG